MHLTRGDGGGDESTNSSFFIVSPSPWPWWLALVAHFPPPTAVANRHHHDDDDVIVFVIERELRQLTDTTDTIRLCGCGPQRPQGHRLFEDDLSLELRQRCRLCRLEEDAKLKLTLTITAKP